ncbi:hypothetical protein OS493_011132 [Desmophyllum pertusum]|uniref:BTB domain-containing protein n=1 Tax=Desmophyllum pertusum TaxID=174260 RepID=A0A9W9Z1Q2_9CNID|nr:hypothetical protein OS493_011132 [Desmophyllum pertusum]
MEACSNRKPSEEDLLGCWEIVSCKLLDDSYPAVEGVKFHLEEGGDLIWTVPPASEQEMLPFFSCETFVFDSFAGELICYGSNVDRIALKCMLDSSQLVLCYDRHLKLCCQKVNQVDSENLSSCPYSLLSALQEGFFTDITFIASNGEKFLAHKTILSCFFADIYTWDKIPPFLENLPPDVLRALLHYLYTCSLPSNTSEDTAKQLLKISQSHGKDIGNLGELCTEFLEATAVKNRIRSLVSDLYSVMEYILQMAESLTTGPRHDSTNTHSVNSCHMHRIDPSKIADVTKMVLRQLAIGMLKFVLLCDIFTKHKSDLSRDERQEIIQHCRKRLPCFVELVEKFLIIFQSALSGLSDSEKEDMALHLIPEIENMWLTCTQLGSDAHLALETITRRADKDHKKKTHLPKMATSLSRTLKNAVHLREVITLKRFHDKVSSSLMFLLQKRGDFSSLSEEQKLRSVVKTMDKIMLEIPEHIHSLHKFPRIFEKKMPWKEWKHSCKVWASFVSLALRKVLANKDILEPVVERTSSLVHEEEFNHLVKDLGFLKESCNDDKTQTTSPPKKSTARVESVVTCPPGDKSPLAHSVMQLLISGDQADMRFILDRTDIAHNSACAECKRISEQNSLEVAAHRVIVATRCDWFRRALLSGMKESIERRILVPDTSPCLFQKFLGYLYGGVLDTHSLSLDDVTELLALSDKYEMDSLKDICEGMLLRDIEGDTVLLYLGMAEQFSVTRLKEECLRFITIHPEVMESELFEELPSNLKKEITDRIHKNMPRVHPIAEEVHEAFAVSVLTKQKVFLGMLTKAFHDYNMKLVTPYNHSRVTHWADYLNEV